MTLTSDIRFAWRAIRSRPTYTLISVLVLGLAIGANATVFSVFNGLFLRPLPYPDGDELVYVYNTYPKMALEFAGTSIPDYLDRIEQAPSLESLAMFNGARKTLGFQGAPEQLALTRATPSLFRVLGVEPMLGRAFTDEEAVPDADRFIVLSHTLWRTRFGGRADIVGEDIRLDGEPYQVLGVMPESFTFPSATTTGWIPLSWAPSQAGDDQRGREFYASIGRLAPGATIAGLNAEMDAIVQRNVERLPNAADFLERTGFTGRAQDLREFTVGDLRQMMLLLQAIVLAVLLIACANVANLQLARVTSRRKELSVRAALGAYRSRLVGLVLTESLMLSLLGAVAGLLVAWGGLELVRTLGLDRANQGFEYALDTNVLLMTAGSAIAAGLVSALLPVAVLWRQNLAQAIHDAGRIGSGGTAAQGLRSALVVGQIAVGVALLVGAGLLTKSFLEVQRQGAGFDPTGVLTARVSLPSNRYADDAAEVRFFEQALAELNALPGVVEAGFVSTLPLSAGNSQASFSVDGYTPTGDQAAPHAQQRFIDHRYLSSIGVSVMRGRGFTEDEPEPVVLVDENVVSRFWPDRDPIGQRVSPDGTNWYTVVGVVPAIKHSDLTQRATKETVYWHYRQRPVSSGAFTIKTALEPSQLTQVVSDAVLRIDPELPLFDVQPYQQRVEQALGPQRAPMVLTLVFAGVAFVLAVVGIYGVLTWAVTQRVGEIGVRMALGARAADIVRMVVRQGGRLTAVGLVLGLVAAVTLGRLMSSQLHGVDALDPGIFALVVVGLALAALAASWIPANRASRIDPMQALRDE